MADPTQLTALQQASLVTGIGTAVVAAIGGLIAAFRAVYEIRQGRLQRKREFAWRQAKEGQALIDEVLQDEKAAIALRMLDWNVRRYTDGKHVHRITHEDVAKSLRIEEGKFDAKEVFIRDAFDALFARMERIENALRLRLTRPQNVRQIGYYCQIMNGSRPKRYPDPSIFTSFVDHYGYSEARALLRRCPVPGVPAGGGRTRIDLGRGLVTDQETARDTERRGQDWSRLATASVRGWQPRFTANPAGKPGSRTRNLG